MPFVLAQIRLGVKVLKPWYGFVIRDVATLTDVFAELSAGKLDSEPPLAEELRSSPATCSAGRSKSVNTLELNCCRVVIWLLGYCKQISHS